MYQSAWKISDMDMTEDKLKSLSSEKLLSIGVLNYIEKKRGVCKAELVEKKPADRHTVLSWEQRNSCLLPEDLKNFYLSSNGLDLSWSVQIDNKEVPVGRMHIHPITQVLKLTNNPNTNHSHNQPSLADLETESDDEENCGRDKPKFSGSYGLFELDDCNGYGKVCLVIRKKATLLTTPSLECEDQSDNEDDSSASNSFTGSTDAKVEIWFLDRSIRWHYLADCFYAYYRLMLMHLGLPQWQYAFTDVGLSIQAKQWFNMYAPIRLEVDLEGILDVNSPRDQHGSTTLCQLDVSKVFKGKSEKKKQTAQNPAQNKKKVPVSSARSQSSLAGKSTSSSSQSSMKGTR